MALAIAFLPGIHAQETNNETGNFDTPSATGTTNRVPRRPRVVSHSPRDDQGRWSNTDFRQANPKLPSLVIVGDSTASTGDPDHRGWGAPLADYFNVDQVNIINRAVGGRSFRTFYGEGKWQAAAEGLKAGDYVVIEFGHNDGAYPTARGPGNRGDLPGTGDETIAFSSTNTDGVLVTNEVVHTFGWYLRTFIREAKAKGAHPIASSTATRSIWKNGGAGPGRDVIGAAPATSIAWTNATVERGMGRMLEWARQVAEEEHVLFVDHSNITADIYEKMGPEAVRALFPVDHTHTSTDGAVLNAETFIAGLKAIPDLPLVNYLNEKGKAIKKYEPAQAIH